MEFWEFKIEEEVEKKEEDIDKFDFTKYEE